MTSFDDQHQGRLNQGGRGGICHPQILTKLWAKPVPSKDCPPDFQTFRRPWTIVWIRRLSSLQVEEPKTEKQRIPHIFFPFIQNFMMSISEYSNIQRLIFNFFFSGKPSFELWWKSCDKYWYEKINRNAKKTLENMWKFRICTFWIGCLIRWANKAKLF